MLVLAISDLVVSFCCFSTNTPGNSRIRNNKKKLQLTGYVRKRGGETARAHRIEAYRSPWWLLVFVVAGLAGATTVHAILERRLELSQLLPFYIGWTLGVIIVWSVIRKISTVSK